MPKALSRYEVLGLALALAWPAWSLGSAALNGRPAVEASSYLLAPIVLVVGAVAGRLLAGADCSLGDPGLRRDDGSTFAWTTLVPVLLALAILPGSPVSLAPGPRPLGYANANAAAALQVMALCAVLLLARGRPPREAWLLRAGLAIAALAIVLHGSMAGLAVGLPLAGVIVVSLWRPVLRPGWVATVGFLSWGAAAITVAVLAASETWPVTVLRALTGVRRDLWQLAWQLWREHPLTGAGPGAFGGHNPYAADADLAAAHSSLLQVGAELGTIGVVLLVAVVGIGLLAVLPFDGLQARSPRLSRDHPRPIAAIASAAWAALWVHSLVDHLFDYPAVPALAGLMLGWATTARDPSLTKP